MRASVTQAIARARAGQGPSLIEARTWRWRGHWAGDDQAYRPAGFPSGLEDPLDLFAYRLLSRGSASLEKLNALHAEVEAEVAAAMQRAAAEPDAGEADLGLEHVYA